MDAVQSNNPNPIYWSYKQCSQMTGLALGTLYSMVSKNEIPHRRLAPKLVVFPVAQTLEWIESNPAAVKPKKSPRLQK